MQVVTLENRVKELITEAAGVPARDPNEALEAIGFDSLDRVDLCNLIEEEFGVIATDAEAQSWVTIGDVIGFVKAHAK